MDLSGFEISTEIDSGGAYAWWRARRLSDGCQVLLRTPRDGEATPEARRLFEREVEVSRDLEAGTGLLKAIDLVESEDGPVLVLDHAPGSPLQGFLNQRAEPVAQTTVLKIASHLAQALSTLHRRDLIHRDLRPANIFYDEASGSCLLYTSPSPRDS